MGILASPGYKTNSLLNDILVPETVRTIDFRGLNRRQIIEDGEMHDMQNLSSDHYPLLTPRRPRGTVSLPSDIQQPRQIFRRYDKIALIAYDKQDNVCFYYDGKKVDKVTGLSGKTRAVCINTKICFFPENTFLTVSQEDGTVTIGEYGHLDASSELTDAEVTISLDSTVMAMPAGHGFGYDDAIEIKGTMTYTPDGETDPTEKEVTVSCIVEDASENSITLPANTFIELTGSEDDITFSGTVSRSIPSFDSNLVIEWNNRLWAASNKDNTLYACKLGDPKNWLYYQGTSLDSYYAQQGSDEIFTAIGEYSGHLLFFKPNSITRVYGTAPSNFQITTSRVFGVEKGSSLSVLTINDIVFYKSAVGIMAYQGGVPYCISDALDCKFADVVAGTEGQKYYASIHNLDTDKWELMVYDIEKALWHKEDDLKFYSTCTIDNSLIYISRKPIENLLLPSEKLYPSDSLYPVSEVEPGYAGIINPQTADEKWKDIEWMALFGPFDEYIEEHKIYSKLAFSLKSYSKERASARIYVSIDDGPWELVKKYEQVSTFGDYLPVIPRRCDRYSVKVVGRGNCAVKSLTRRVRQGSLARI